jgi:hypothetical protein
VVTVPVVTPITSTTSTTLGPSTVSTPDSFKATVSITGENLTTLSGLLSASINSLSQNNQSDAYNYSSQSVFQPNGEKLNTNNPSASNLTNTPSPSLPKNLTTTSTLLPPINTSTTPNTLSFKAGNYIFAYTNGVLAVDVLPSNKSMGLEIRDNPILDYLTPEQCAIIASKRDHENKAMIEEIAQSLCSQSQRAEPNLQVMLKEQ